MVSMKPLHHLPRRHICKHIELISQGFPSTFGVFREYFFKNPPFEGAQEVAYVGPIGLVSPATLRTYGK
jgi:hypothetical protein